MTLLPSLWLSVPLFRPQKKKCWRKNTFQYFLYQAAPAVQLHNTIIVVCYFAMLSKFTVSEAFGQHLSTHFFCAALKTERLFSLVLVLLLLWSILEYLASLYTPPQIIIQSVVITKKYLWKQCGVKKNILQQIVALFKVHISWEGYKILRNLHLTSAYSTYSQK